MRLLKLARIVTLSLAATLAACSTGPQPQEETTYPDPIFSADRMLFENQAQAENDIWDPWEGMNRRIYNFNYQFDKYVFLPVSDGYNRYIPQFARTGVTNFFDNFQDMTTMVHSILQLAPDKFFQSTGRVFVNSTLGIFGLFDVADTMGIPRPQEDFGQTLGYWGVDQGPFLVIPFLGPSNLRDGAGMLTDFYAIQAPIRDEVWTKDMRTYGFLLEAVDTRANTSFRYYENGSAFEYEFVRLLWSTKRDLDIAK